MPNIGLDHNNEPACNWESTAREDELEYLRKEADAACALSEGAAVNFIDDSGHDGWEVGAKFFHEMGKLHGRKSDAEIGNAITRLYERLVNEMIQK